MLRHSLGRAVKHLTLGRLSLFTWETTLGNRIIPDRSTEPYPQANGEQTRHARGHVRSRTIPLIL